MIARALGLPRTIVLLAGIHFIVAGRFGIEATLVAMSGLPLAAAALAVPLPPAAGPDPEPRGILADEARRTPHVAD
jgi:hypothetical protein